MDIEELSKQIKEHRDSEPSELAMPQDEKLLKTLKRYWKEFKPKNLQDALWFSATPQVYYIWKMPLDAHKKVNALLATGISLLARYQPEAAVAGGMLEGVSQAVYGLKTIGKKEDSGKHVTSGLIKLLENSEKIKTKDSSFTEKLRSFIENYLIKFNPKLAKAA